MHLQTIPEAARTCGRSPREVRLMVESGELSAVRHMGRWLIDPLDLPSGHGPAPAAEIESERVQARTTVEEPVLSAVPATAPAHDRVRVLEADLCAMRQELDVARRRISELESSSFGRALRGSGERGALAPLFRPTTDLST